MTRADLVLLDGNVLTMNPSQPRAEAIAIEKDRIVKVGTNEEITQLIGKTTKVVELKKRIKELEARLKQERR